MEKVYVTPDPVNKGTKTDLHCEFKNAGGDLKGTWRVSYQIDGKEVYTQKWGDIPAGGFRNPSGVWTAGEPGKHIFTCVLDPDKSITEISESNNTLKTEFSVKGQMEIGLIKPGHTVPISTGVVPIARPDLAVRISASNKAYSGEPIQVVELVVRNVGKAKAKGTDTAGSDGYMVDIVLSKDNDLPVEFAVLGDKYKEDMLLIGGRMSHTPDLAPGESKTWVLKRIIKTLPDTPTGKYCLGAVVDPGLKINESNETNNTHCTAINLHQMVK
jgi:subtilase family serine protease